MKVWVLMQATNYPYEGYGEPSVVGVFSGEIAAQAKKTLLEKSERLKRSYVTEEFFLEEAEADKCNVNLTS